MKRKLCWWMAVVLPAALGVCAPAAALEQCGDQTCGAGEDFIQCRQDCGIPVVVDLSERVVATGPNIRAIAADNAVLAGIVAVGGGKMTLKAVTFADVDDPSVRTTVPILQRPNDGEGNLGNAKPFRFPDGQHLLMAFRDHVGVEPTKTYRLRVAFSDDQGAHWNQGTSLEDGLIEQSDHGLWEPFLFLDAAGTLRVVYARERENHLICPASNNMGQDIVMRASIDGGHTWDPPVVVATEGVSRDGVPSVTRLKDGSYLLVFESWLDGTCGAADPALVVRSMQSRDGIVWENRQLVHAAVRTPGTLKGGERASWPYVITLDDGRAAVTFTTDEGHYTTHEEKNFDIVLLLSKGGAAFDSLEWDADHTTHVFKYDPLAETNNRYASSVAFGQEEVLVFSGLPERFRRVQLQH